MSERIVTIWQEGERYWLAYAFANADGSWTEYNVSNEDGDEDNLIEQATALRMAQTGAI